MNLNLRQFVLLILDAAGGTIPGKTYLQKLCFFVGVKIGNKELGFRPHYYGPYSDQISAELSFLKGAGFVNERRARSGFSDERGWELTRYDYSLTDEGRTVVASLRSKFESDAIQISDAVKSITDAGHKDYIALSLAAKTFWIVANNGSSVAPVSFDKIIEEADSLNWKVSPNEVSAATDILEKLSLVKRVSVVKP